MNRTVDKKARSCASIWVTANCGAHAEAIERSCDELFKLYLNFHFIGRAACPRV